MSSYNPHRYDDRLTYAWGRGETTAPSGSFFQNSTRRATPAQCAASRQAFAAASARADRKPSVHAQNAARFLEWRKENRHG